MGKSVKITGKQILRKLRGGRMTPYTEFMRQCLRRMAEEHPEMTPSQRLKECVAEWRLRCVCNNVDELT